MNRGALRNSSANSFVVKSAKNSISQKKKVKYTQTYGNTARLTENLTITDITEKEQDIEDEYSFILNLPAKVRCYELKSRETKNNVTIEFSNYIFGNFCIDENSENYNKALLVNTFSRSRIIEATINCFGFMSTDDENQLNDNIRKEIFQKFQKLQPPVLLTRNDSSNVFILKIGDITISTQSTKENMGQFLIFSADYQKWVSQVYLCYSKINMDLLETSNLYRYNVANVLVSPVNLDSSRYIGTVIEDEIALEIEKLDLPFADSVSVPLENISNIN
ncbi:MAG: hypothetical protein K6B70_06185 [Clostridia bacterium]|nr:hypothetical protein [Clostridia bacterium]